MKKSLCVRVPAPESRRGCPAPAYGATGRHGEARQAAALALLEDVRSVRLCVAGALDRARSRCRLNAPPSRGLLGMFHQNFPLFIGPSGVPTAQRHTRVYVSVKMLYCRRVRGQRCI